MNQQKVSHNTPELSILVPVFNEEGNIEKLFFEVRKIIVDELNTSFEMIFIDDGSIDKSWASINCLADDNQEVRGLRFSRNFGHQYAIKAGMDVALGKAVISMDADLQHPPYLIKQLFDEWKRGYDLVFAKRTNTKGINFLKKYSASLFYAFISRISDVKLEDGVSDFRLIDRKVVDELNKMNEYFLFYRGLTQWTGFKTKYINYVAEIRFSGKTKYSIKKMINLAINGIMSFSVKPLRIATISGILVSLFSFIYIVYALLAKFILHIALPGWTSILISVLFLGGIQLFTIGILGEYIGKIFIEIKQRPKYIIREKRESILPKD